MDRNTRLKLHRLLNSNGCSLFLLLFVVAVLAFTAYFITQSLQEEPDFGGMITIRQADMGINGDLNSEKTKLSRAMILDFITAERNLTAAARRCGWDLPYAEMRECIDVKERLSSQNSYIVIANTKNAERSMRVARALSVAFLENYREKWEVRSRQKLIVCAEKIRKYDDDLLSLKKLKERFQEKNELRPLNTEIEMEALNTQLVEAQRQFFTAYGAFLTRMEEKRSNFRLELDLARQVRTDKDNEIINMKRQMAELDRQCDVLKKQMTEQKPNVYRMLVDYPKLTDVPNDILYFYENIQNLQQIKLAMLLDSIIEEKEKMLNRERNKQTTLERLLDSRSCDVFLREGGR